MRRGEDYVSSDRDRISGLATYYDEATGVYVLSVQYHSLGDRGHGLNPYCAFAPD